MSRNLETGTKSAQPEGARLGVITIIGVVALLAIGGIVFALKKHSAETVAQVPAPGTEEPVRPNPVNTRLAQPGVDEMPEPSMGSVRPPPVNPAITARTTPTPAVPAIALPRADPHAN